MLGILERRRQCAVSIGPNGVWRELPVLHVEQIIHVPKPIELLIVFRIKDAIAAARIAVVLRALVTHAALLAAGMAERRIGARARHNQAKSHARKMCPQIVLA